MARIGENEGPSSGASSPLSPRPGFAQQPGQSLQLIVLIALVYGGLRLADVQALQAACVGLACGLLLSAVDHVLRRQWYVAVMSPWIPRRGLIVNLSAAARAVLAVLLVLGEPYRQGALIGTLVLLLIVLQVNLRVALAGHRIAATESMPAATRWLRLGAHLLWLAWAVACLAGAIAEVRHRPGRLDKALEDAAGPDQ